MSRCLPFDSTALTTLPTTSKRAASELIRGAITSNPVTTRPASARRRTFATRGIVSPSGIPFHVAPRRAREAGGAERVGEWRLVDRKTIDLVEEERRAPVGVRLGRERVRDQSARVCHVALFSFGERQERALIARQPGREDTVEKHNERTRGAHRATPLRALRPGERGAVHVRRIRSGER